MHSSCPGPPSQPYTRIESCAHTVCATGRTSSDRDSRFRPPSGMLWKKKVRGPPTLVPNIHGSKDTFSTLRYRSGYGAYARRRNALCSEGTYQVTDSGVLELLSCCPRLTGVELSANSRISGKALGKMIDAERPVGMALTSLSLVSGHASWPACLLACVLARLHVHTLVGLGTTALVSRWFRKFFTYVTCRRRLCVLTGVPGF